MSEKPRDLLDRALALISRDFTYLENLKRPLSDAERTSMTRYARDLQSLCGLVEGESEKLRKTLSRLSEKQLRDEFEMALAKPEAQRS